jgi:hypothetical protein
MKNLTLKVIGAVIIAFGLAGCYPDQLRGYSDYDMVVTDYDSKVNFDTYSTFHLPDTVVDIIDTNDTKIHPLTRAQQTAILAEIRQNLLDLGWSEVDSIDSTNLADVIITTTAVRSEFSVYYQYWYSYWDYWYGWGYYPGYGGGYYYPGYPWYPGYGGIYKEDYKVGSIQIDMIRPFDVEDNNEFPVAWSANIYGLLSSNQSSNESRYASNISLAFDQSTYLKK